jgi:hypothetical protein
MPTIAAPPDQEHRVRDRGGPDSWNIDLKECSDDAADNVNLLG